MKKQLFISLLIAALVAIAGCGKKDTVSQVEEPEKQTPNSIENTVDVTKETVKQADLAPDMDQDVSEEIHQAIKKCRGEIRIQAEGIKSLKAALMMLEGDPENEEAVNELKIKIEEAEDELADSYDTMKDLMEQVKSIRKK